MFGSVADRQNDVTDRRRIECWQGVLQLDRPAAFDPRALEREIAFVAQSDLEQPAVVHRGAGGNRRDASAVGNEATVVGLRTVAAFL